MNQNLNLCDTLYTMIGGIIACELVKHMIGDYEVTIVEILLDQGISMSEVQP